MNVEPTIAAQEVCDLCDKKVSDYKALTDDEKRKVRYPIVSVRSILAELGYDNEEQDHVIRWLAEKGFYYCIDPIIACTAIGVPVPEYPSRDVCYWDPDQITSRIRFIR